MFDKTKLIFLSVFCLAGYALGTDQRIKTHICQSTTVVFQRRVEIRYQDQESPVPCTAVFYRDVENFQIPHLLFRAVHEVGKCEQKEQEYLKKMQAWGSQCDLLAPPKEVALKEEVAPVRTPTMTAQTLDSISVNHPFNLPVFRLSFLASIREGNSFSPELSWNPSYAFNRTLGLRGNLGVTGLRTQKTFLALEYLAGSYFNFTENISLEASIGLQTWVQTQEGTNFLYNVGPSFRFNEKVFSYFDLVSLSISQVFLTGKPVTQFKLGIQASF